MGNGASTLQEHPTGAAAAGATIFVLLWNKFTHMDFGAEEGAILIGAVATLVSAFTPRWRRN